MIGRLRGTLLVKRAPELLIDVGGVGYEVQAPMSTFYELPEPGAEVVLHTHLQVREDQHTLYGFFTEAERSLFRNLLKVNGVGAKLALTILSGTSTDGFVQCVQQQDSAALTRLPGVGKKTAERLIVEMRDRLTGWDAGAAAPGGDGGDSTAPRAASAVEDAVSALIALGYKPPEASRMVRAVPNSAELDSEEIIRLSLQAAVK